MISYIIIILIVSIILSIAIHPLLSAGANNIDLPALTIKGHEPVVSQTGVSIKAIDQIIPQDPHSVPGNMSKIWTAEELHGFENTELTQKTYGFPEHQALFKNWNTRENDWKVEYADKKPPRPFKPTEYTQGRLTNAISNVSDKYYHNPAGYCNSYPEQYPCPNNWIKNNKPQKPDPSSMGSLNMQIPGLAKGFYQKPLSQPDSNTVFNIENKRGYI